jgi:predicted fused transcriptional regulator/phosphomethylpyrimidine kinase
MDNMLEKQKVLGNLVMALENLEKCPEFVLLIPEVRVNLAYALPDAKTRRDVAAVEGRITEVGGLPRASGLPSFGASDHLARLIIEIRKYETEINAAINFKCDSTLIEIAQQYCAGHQWLFGRIDRRQEPAEIIQQDGTSMPWKIKQLVDSSHGVPRIFFEGEGWGKEPLFVAVGKDALEVTVIAIEIARRYTEKIGALNT